MKRKHKVLLFLLLLAPLILVISPACYLFIPASFLAVLKYFAPVALVIVIVCCLLPITKQRIQYGIPRALPTASWLSVILLIELALYFLFLGQLAIINQYYVVNNLHSSSAIVSHTTQPIILSLFVNWGLFPWSLIALVTLLFYFSFIKSKQPHHLTQNLRLTKRPHTLSNFLQRMGDIYIIAITLNLTALFISFAAAAITHMLYPGFSSLLSPLTGILTALLLVVLGGLKKTEKVFNKIQIKKLAPLKPLLLQLFLLIIIIFPLSFVINHYLMPYNATAIKKWTPLELFQPQLQPTIDKLFTFFWWLLITPLVSSLICYYSRDKSLRAVLTLLLLPPLILLLITQHWQQPILNFITQPNTAYFMQLVSILLILALFKESSKNQILWLGYMPLTSMKKLRVINTRIIWLFAALLLGIFSITGIQGLTLIFSLGIIPLLVIYSLRTIGLLKR